MYTATNRKSGADCARRNKWSGTSALALALAVGGLVGAQVSADVQPSTAKAASTQAPLHRKGLSLEDHVNILTKALDLDVKQQAELRRLLENQREQIRNLWDDTSVPPADRVNATRVISNRTADRIRAMLNDEQKKKYNPPPQPHEAAPDSSSRTVDEWMKATQSQ